MAYATGGKYKTVTFDAVGIAQTLPGVNPRDYDNTVNYYVNDEGVIGTTVPAPNLSVAIPAKATEVSSGVAYEVIKDVKRPCLSEETRIASKPILG